MKVALKFVLFSGALLHAIEVDPGETARALKQKGDKRIVGGTPVSVPYPFFASFGSCGASLIHPDIALTAAHCDIVASRAIDLGVLDKSTKQSTRNIVKRSIHPNYDEINLAYDFMLLLLESPVSQEPIPMNAKDGIPRSGQNLTIIGMGRIAEDGPMSSVLREASVQVLSDEACARRYATNLDPKTMFCASGDNTDSCKGDSGGPIFTTKNGLVKKQVGLVSWGYGCGSKQFPGVYAELSVAHEWISSEVCRLSSLRPAGCPPPTPAPTPVPPLPNEAQITILIQADELPHQISWFLFHPNGTIVQQVLPGFYKNPFETYETTFKIERGLQYEFFIQDFGRDGLCCANGDGAWSITTGNTSLASGADFGDSMESPIYVPIKQSVASSTGSPSSLAPIAAPPTERPTSLSTAPPTPEQTETEEPNTTTAAPSVELECLDSNDSVVHVDDKIGNQTCHWLETHKDRYGYLCQFVDIAIECPFTCDFCSLLR